jgi:hypothetical protein
MILDALGCMNNAACCPWNHGLWPKKTFKLAWRCQQPLSGFLANDHLPRMSRMSANDKGDNEMTLGAVYRSPGIYLTDEENPRTPQLGDR